MAALDRSAIDFLCEHLSAASLDRERAWIVAAYQAPRGVPLAACMDLDAG